ncbi:MAG: tetratricopeptide repeat protein [Acidiferrobacterales bacterium]
MKDHEDILGDINALQQRASTTSQYRQAAKLFQQDRLADAETLAQKILKDQPEHADALYLSGFIAFRRRQFDSSIQQLERAISHSQSDPGYFFALALSLNAVGRSEEALTACEQAIQLNPQLTDALIHRGIVLRNMDRPGDAEESLRLAVKLNPDIAMAHEGLASVLNLQGRLDEAEQSLRRALELQPDFAMAHSNLLFLLAARAKISPAELLEEQRRWDEVHGQEGRLRQLPARAAETSTERRLRIGYVSPDLRTHAVSRFFEPLLAAHDRTRFEIFCYASHEHQLSDATTERLREFSEHWRFVTGRTDSELARIIYEDGIDILVDLAGHTGNNRLKAFTYRPAPVQATYLGFFAASGLEAMDYWITDGVLHPPDTQEQTLESIYRLPRCSFCYKPPAEAPEISPCPNTDDQVVFGSFHHLSKLGAELIATWSRLLRQLPNSRLFFMDKSLGDARARQRLAGQFAQNDIHIDRLSINTGLPYREYLATYSQIDIVLDAFPRTGGTTTAEALWMGVPVVALAGRSYAGRISASKLAALGLEDLIAHSREDYIDKAVALAREPDRRAALRAKLREKMAESQLCDGRGLALAMENAYLRMWERSG